MRNKNFYKYFSKAMAVCACVLMVLSLAACRQSSQNNQSNQNDQSGGSAPEQAAEAGTNTEAKADGAAGTNTAAEDRSVEYIQQFIGEMDLTGSWEDEISQRASMDVEQIEDGTYVIRVHWGGSATETAVWEIRGQYDAVSGMLPYYEGLYSVHTFDENNKETISDDAVTEGAFMKEGDKLRWRDSKNSEDCLFVKVQ